MTLLHLEAAVFQKQGCTFTILGVYEKECFTRQMREVGRRFFFFNKSHPVIVEKGEKDGGIW